MYAEFAPLRKMSCRCMGQSSGPTEYESPANPYAGPFTSRAVSASGSRFPFLSGANTANPFIIPPARQEHAFGGV